MASLFLRILFVKIVIPFDSPPVTRAPTSTSTSTSTSTQDGEDDGSRFAARL
jgi:hypothetical protein